VIDKDAEWLDALENQVHTDWALGLMTNTMRSYMLERVEKMKEEIL
jgi:hypothetical protein